MTASGATTISVSWVPSTDNVGVAGYAVYQNGSRIATTSETTHIFGGLSCGLSYTLGVDAYDAAGNRSAQNSIVVATSPCLDTTAPSAPTGVGVTSASATSISILWSPSFDNSGVRGYEVFLNRSNGSTALSNYTFSGLVSVAGTPVMVVTETRATLSSLTCGTTYAIGVDAFDTAGNRSPATTLSAATDPCPASPPPPPTGDTMPPATPTGLAASGVTQTGLTLTWNASSDNVGVTGYDVVRNGTKIASVTATSASQAGLTCGTSYMFAVVAYDAAANRSQEAQLSVSTLACSSLPPADTTPPSQPANLGVLSSAQTSVSLTWTPSMDNAGVAGYGVYRNGTSVSTTNQPGATVSSLTCGTAYTFEVDAYDAAGNRSTRASVIGSTSACPDTQPPTAPTNVTASSRTATSIALSWSPSSDNVGVTGYGLYRGNIQVGTSAVITGIVSGLTCNTNYTLAVDASDAAGNRSSQTVVMVSTTACADTTPPSTATALAASNVTQTSLGLTWSASSDNVAVTGYDVYRNGTKMATVTSTSSSQTGLACDTSYAFAVVAFDAAGNRSGQAQLTAPSAACSAQPPALPSSGQLTGAHWVEPNEDQTIKNIGYGFAITNVAPGDLAGAKAKLDAAHAAGIKLIIGLYSFGGPDPYTFANGQFSMSQAAIDSVNYLESRSSDILAFFGFNEPYWLNQFTGQGDKCGAYSAAQLRQFSDMIRTVWPGAKIYHDIGWPSEWAPGGDLYNAYSCIGQKYADATGVADYVGIWDYPFQGTAYNKTQGIARLAKESNYVINSMGAIPVSLGQSMTEGSTPWPTKAQLQDWNCAMRAALPQQALISWYVWRQSIYNDYLVNHPDYWPLTTQAAC